MRLDTNQHKSRKYFGIAISGALLLFLSLFIYEAFARNSGITGTTGSSGSGCNCHSTSPNTNTSVSASIEGGSWTVNTGETYEITITVSNSSQSAAGLNVAIKDAANGGSNAGSITSLSGQGTQVSGGELTHTTRKNISNDEATFTFEWTAPNSPGTYYLRANGNAVNSNSQNSGDEWNRMTTQEITVEAPPVITLNVPDGGQNWCAGGSFDITWDSENVNNINIELSTDGGNSWPEMLASNIPAGSGSWTWDIPMSKAPGTQHKIRISDPSDGTVNDVSTGNFTISAGVSINSNPMHVTECTNESVTFDVAATGANLSFQWRKNGGNISGATSSSYSISSITAADAAVYDVVVTDACNNSQVSDTASLFVNVKPSVTTQPESQEVCSGTQVTLSVVAEGTGINYQWLKDGLEIPGETNSELVFNNVSENDEADYSVRVSGICTPPAVSQVANLTVNTTSELLSQTGDQVICIGETLIIALEVNGDNLQFNWEKDGNPLSQFTGDTIIIENASVEDAGLYSCEITGACGTGISITPMTIIVNTLTEITEQPQSQTVDEGTQVEFEVKFEGQVNSFQWSKNQVDIQGATSAKYVIESTALSHAGEYRCRLNTPCGDIQTEIVELSVNSLGSGPVIVYAPGSYDFGNVKINETRTQQITIRNTGDADLTIDDISIEGDIADFSATLPNFPLTIQAEGTIEIQVGFKPTVAGERTATVSATSNAINAAELNLFGNGTEETSIEISLTTIDFGNVLLGNKPSETFTITNNGSESTNLSLVITGPGASAFSVSPGILTIDGSVDAEINVSFDAASEGVYDATVSVMEEDIELGRVNLFGSVVITSIFDFITLDGVKTFPLPSENNMNIVFELTNSTSYSLAVYDMNGRLVYSKSESAVSGVQRLYWSGVDANGDKVPAGVYNAVLTIAGEAISTPLVISR